MRKTFLLLPLFAAVLFLFAGCGAKGQAADADSEEGYANAIELLKKNIETSRYKVYYMKFETTSKMANNMESVTVKMVNDKDLAFSQKFMIVGNNRVMPMESVVGTFESPVYKDTKGIDLSKLDAKAIVAQIDAAKKLIPEGAEFKSIDEYCISESVPAGNVAFNEGKTFGEQTTTFTVVYEKAMTEGAEPGIFVTRATVQPDGSVKLD